MSKDEESGVPTGYKRPPQHTQFQPGQSGNPSGRPKRKASTLTEKFELELDTSITVTEGGKPLKMTKLEAIVKQQTNKALQGDYKAAALLMKIVQLGQLKPMNNLSPVLDAMQAIHAKHETDNKNGTQSPEALDRTRSAENKVDNAKD